MNILLKSELYTINNCVVQDNQIDSAIRITDTHEIFEGHFPNQPVVPGVCMMEISKEIFQQHFNRKIQLEHGGQTKFLQLLVPNNEALINVIIQHKPIIDSEIEKISLNVVWKHNEQIIFKLIGTYIYI